MPVPRIILIWRHLILREAVLNLLAQARLELVADYEQPVDAAMIPAQTPSHVLLEAGEEENGRFLADLLQQDGITIIRLNLEDNRLQIFQRQDHALESPADFINLLHVVRPKPL